jgi:hypothetical protein
MPPLSRHAARRTPTGGARHVAAAARIGGAHFPLVIGGAFLHRQARAEVHGHASVAR